MLRSIVYIILIIWLAGWLLGVAFHFATGLIHLLLLVALILFILDIFNNRNNTTIL